MTVTCWAKTFVSPETAERWVVQMHVLYPRFPRFYVYRCAVCCKWHVSPRRRPQRALAEARA